MVIKVYELLANKAYLIFVFKYQKYSTIPCTEQIPNIRSLKIQEEGFPHGPVIKTSSCNAEDTGSIPSQGGSHILWGSQTHLPQQLRLLWSTCVTFIEPRHCNFQSQCSAKEKPLQRETQTPQLESSPCSPQLEKAYPEQQRPSTAKNKQISKNIRRVIFYYNLSLINTNLN